jgi:hypothetical protein
MQKKEYLPALERVHGKEIQKHITEAASYDGRAVNGAGATQCNSLLIVAHAC